MRFGHVVPKQGQVVVNRTHQLEVDQGLVQRRVAGTFAESKGRTVNHVRSSEDSRQVVGHTEASVLMAVPIDLDL